jgi:histidine ammonia-lyase
MQRDVSTRFRVICKFVFFFLLFCLSDPPHGCTTQIRQSKVPSMLRSGDVIVLDGESLSVEHCFWFGRNPAIRAELSEAAKQRICAARQVIDDVVKLDEVRYGVNTGFGSLADVRISKENLKLLQLNLIRSHCAGVGAPLSLERVRRVFLLRLNVLSKGNSGIRLETMERALKILNTNCLPCIPEKGSVGASGDLAPLAHLALGMLGEGNMWDPTLGKWDNAREVLQRHDLQPLQLAEKEGISLINGTQFICALVCEALFRAENLARSADIITALTIEGLKGTTAAFDRRIHEARPHLGQAQCAARLRSLLHSPRYPSEIAKSHEHCGKVQDAYSLRCSPQVHGIVIDTIAFVKGIISTEINSATDNPMVFAEKSDEDVHEEIFRMVYGHSLDPRDPTAQLGREEIVELMSHFNVTITADEAEEFIRNVDRQGNGKIGREELFYWYGHVSDTEAHEKASSSKFDYLRDAMHKDNKIISGGNFHGEYPAKAADYLAIGVAELASISERRIERLVNASLSGLPPFLAKNGGLNSGFMMAHVTASALVSENKTLCHPASADSISTSAAREDHVSMGAWAARKLLSVIENVEYVLAIELLAAYQALNFLRPLHTTEPLEAVIRVVGAEIPPFDQDRVLHNDMVRATEIVRAGTLWNTIHPYLHETK